MKGLVLLRYYCKKRGFMRPFSILAAVLFAVLPYAPCGASGHGGAADSLAIFEESLLERLENITDQIAAEGEIADAESLLEYYSALASDPLNINRAGRADLQGLLFLTPFQIESLLDYRKHGGALLSLDELALLNGFDTYTAELLRPLIFFGPAGGSGDEKPGLRSELYLRTFTKWEDFSPAFLAKYGCSYGERLSLNITAESDAGEQLFTSWKRPFDFVSASLSCSNLPLGGKHANDLFKEWTINTLVLGDFSARLGQGLVLWNSFSPWSATQPSSFYRRGAPLLPYTSSGESDFYRGAAVWLTVKNMDISLLVSCNRKDARIENGKYVTIYDDGLHDTPQAMARRKTMSEYLGAASVGWSFPDFKVGINCIAYMYDRRCGTKPLYYNKYRLYDGLWGNLSLDFAGRAAGFSLFGEIAADRGGALAIVAGASKRFAGDWEAGVQLRHYPADYIAPHAGASSSLSGCYNQTGAVASFSYSSFGRFALEGTLDFCYYPKPRHNIRKPGSHLKASLKFSRVSADGIWNCYVKLSDTWLSVSNLYDFPTNRFSVVLNVERNAGGLFSFGANSRHSFMLGTYSVSVGVKASLSFRRLVAKAGATFYNARLWANRLYTYESELPGTYGGSLLYGKGFSGYVLLKYAFLKKTALYVKFGGTGTSKRLRLGLKVKFG